MKTINLFTCCLASAALLFTGCVRDEFVPRSQPEITLLGTYSLHVGQPLSTLTPGGTAAFEGEKVEGAFAWKNGAAAFDRTAEYDAEWIFTPVDAGVYEPVEGTEVITVHPNVYAC